MGGLPTQLLRARLSTANGAHKVLHVSERFFALHGLMKELHLHHVLHLENDITVYGDLRPLVEKSMRYRVRLASTFLDVKRGHSQCSIPLIKFKRCSQVLYVRDEKALESAF